MHGLLCYISVLTLNRGSLTTGIFVIAYRGQLEILTKRKHVAKGEKGLGKRIMVVKGWRKIMIMIGINCEAMMVVGVGTKSETENIKVGTEAKKTEGRLKLESPKHSPTLCSFNIRLQAAS